MLKNGALICLFILFILAPFFSLAAENDITTNRGKLIQGESEKIRCYQFPSYYIIEKKQSSGVGFDFLVKFLASKEDNLPKCSYSPEKDDFEIKGEFAAYFWMVKNNLLFLEHYTGPAPYSITIWDLNSREKAFESTCNAPVTVLHDLIHFWLETGAASKENCPELPQWESHGLGGAIETKVILDLSDMKLRKTGETRCSIRQ